METMAIAQVLPSLRLIQCQALAQGVSLTAAGRALGFFLPLGRDLADFAARAGSASEPADAALLPSAGSLATADGSPAVASAGGRSEGVAGGLLSSDGRVTGRTLARSVRDRSAPRLAKTESRCLLVGARARNYPP